MEYTHKSITKVAELFEKHNAELGKGFDPMALIWRSISPQIPEWLAGLDRKPDMLGSIKKFVDELAVALTEDSKIDFEDKVGEEDGSGN